MTAYLLYYRETSRVESTHAYMKRFATMHGMETVVIDRKGDMPGSVKRFPDIKAAMAAPDLAGHEWVFLDAKGDVHLDKYPHPVDDVVYCIGSDFDGFDGLDVKELPGVKVKIRQLPNRKGEWYASIVAPIVVCYRYMYMQGRGK